MKCDLVFEGGGVKGLLFVGAAAVLQENGYVFNNMAGTSAGGIAAVLFGAGYQPQEVRKILMDLDFTKFKDPNIVGRFPIVGQIYELMMSRGLYKGDFFYNFIKDQLKAKDVTTFKDLVMPGITTDKYRYRARVVVSDITSKAMRVFPDDIRLYGQNPDDMEVALAVRASMSIPYFYRPILINTINTITKQNEVYTIVDGGVCSNDPAWIFDTDGIPEWPTFNLLQVPSTIPPIDDESRGPIVELWDLIDTMMSARDKFIEMEPSVKVRTITMASDLAATDFNITQSEKEFLYQTGREAMTRFLLNWDFEKYKRDFRS